MPQREPLQRPRDVPDVHPGPVGDLLPRGGPEGGEVAPHDQLASRVEVDVVAADPVLARGDEVGPPPLPGARGRNADEWEAGEDSSHLVPPAELLLELLPAPRAVGEDRACSLRVLPEAVLVAREERPVELALCERSLGAQGRAEPSK
jgi:hypothetical protein